MQIEITIPSPGESISEVVLGPWQKTSGEWVEKDESLVEIESDKVTLEVPAVESGVLTISAAEGAEMRVGDVIGSIDPGAKRPEGAKGGNGEIASKAVPGADATAPSSVESAAGTSAGTVEVATATSLAAGTAAGTAKEATSHSSRATSLAKKLAADRGVPLTGVRGTGPSGRITKSDVLAAADGASASASSAPSAGANLAAAPPMINLPTSTRGVRRERMSRLRQRIAERLVQAQRDSAMLTTFNEADMTEVMRLRAKHKESFKEKYGVGLGFMSFFAKSCVSALQTYEGVNAYIDGTEVEYHDFVDISIAVGTPKGLVVPILRNVELMSFAQIETGIKDLAVRARDGKLTMEDMTGGTFTISNGGVYGSLTSTPILNPPQSGILGMHKIMNRAVEDPKNPGQVALRPMMYLALSYDHRIVDGEQAVRFLVHVRECIEDPERMMLGL